MNKLRKESKIIKEYHDIYQTDTAAARKLIKALDYEKSANLLAEIATSYFDEGKLRLAERYTFKAYEIDNLNPKVLWILALVKWDYGQLDSAIFNFQEIIRIGVRRINKCGIDESLGSALARINDSKFQLFRLLKNTKPAVAKRYFNMYEKGLEKGVFSLMNIYYSALVL